MFLTIVPHTTTKKQQQQQKHKNNYNISIHVKNYISNVIPYLYPYGCVLYQQILHVHKHNVA